MKIYSDTLTGADLAQGLAYAERTAPQPAALGWHRFTPILGVRVRARGWNVLLYDLNSGRRFNTGHYGAGETGAASHDTYGRMLAYLFTRDPKMRAAHYDGVVDFRVQTNYRYTTDTEG